MCPPPPSPRSSSLTSRHLSFESAHLDYLYHFLALGSTLAFFTLFLQFHDNACVSARKGQVQKIKLKREMVMRGNEFPGFARVNKVTSASLGYLLSVFNKNSTLK